MASGFTINPEGPVPIFRQIVDGIRAAIARGALEPGGLLPSVRALAEELGVNPNTVHRAFSELEREGLVAAERGKGMVVLVRTRSSARSAGEDAVLTRLAEALRHARSIGLSEERFEALLARARRQVGDALQETVQ